MKSLHALLLGIGLLGIGTTSAAYGAIVAFVPAQTMRIEQSLHPEILDYAPAILAIGLGLVAVGIALVALSPRMPRRSARPQAKRAGLGAPIVPISSRPF